MATLLDDLLSVVQEGRRARLRPDVLRTKLKEKLQLYVLDFICNTPAYNHLIFYGGTCLRICFNAGRISEDLDFETTNDSFDKEKLANDLKKYFTHEIMFDKLNVHVPGRNISRVELRFPVLHELGVSLHEAENLILKVEVNVTDKKYPVEFKTISADRFSFVIRHYDLPTLMAGKIVACLERIWKKGMTGANFKGRDFFDLIWYMQKGVVPNNDRLLASKGQWTIDNAFKALAEKISKISPRALLQDIEPLFEDGKFTQNWVKTFHQEFEKLRKQY